MTAMNPIFTAQTDTVESLYNHHQSWLCGWLRRKLGCRETAQDLTQDTFIRLLCSAPPQPLNEPRAYLLTVARGLMINWVQRQSLERAYHNLLMTLPECYAPAPEQRLIVLEVLQTVDAMLGELPPRTRDIFLMAQLEGLTYDEIAQRLSVSLSTVKRSMKQGFYHCLLAMS